MRLKVEIKISKADFKKDFTHKIEKHNLFRAHREPIKCVKGFEDHMLYGKDEAKFFDELSGRHTWARGSSIYFDNPAKKLPNRFYYCAPEGIIDISEVPAYAGLMIISNGYVKEVKKAPLLHKEKNDLRHVLLKKYYWKVLKTPEKLRLLQNKLYGHITDEGCEILTDFILNLNFD